MPRSPRDQEREDPPEQVTSRIWLSDAVLLSFAGVYFYGIAFAYEASYLDTFGIPADLVRTSLGAVLSLATRVGGGLFALYWITNAVALFWPRHPVLQIKLARIALISLLVLTPGLLFGFDKSDLVPGLILAAFVLIAEFAWPLALFRGRGSALERFAADEVAENPARARTIFGRVRETAGPVAYVLIVGGYVSLQLAISAGVAEATRTRDFFTVPGAPGWVVVRVYPEQLLAVAIDPSTRAVQGQFQIRPISSDGVRLLREPLGPLDFSQVIAARRRSNPRMELAGSAGGSFDGR